MMKNYLFKIVFITLLTSSGSLTSQTDRYWSGGSGASDNIDQGDNWFNGNPSSGDNLYFDNTCGSCRLWPFSNYGSGSFFGNFITYNGAGQIRFRGDNSYFFKIENFNSPDLLEIENSTIGNRIGANLEINPVGSGGITILSSSITIDNNGGSRQLLVYGDHTLTINASIQDINGSGGSFNIIDNATVIFNGDNTYSGATTVSSGSLLRLNGNLANSDVVVQSGATLEISNTITVKSITVEAGGYLQIDSGQTLTVSNDINLESNSTSYSSLISDGTIVGTINYSRNVNFAAGQGTSTAANDLISPPLSGMTFGDLHTANSNILSGTIGGGPLLYLFGPFDNVNNEYVLYADTTDDGIVLDTGVGYRTGSTDGGSYTFTGGVETGSISEVIEAPSGGSIWNLIGNPYPSYIRLDEFLSINNGQFDASSTGIYGYDGTAADGWTIWNNITLLDPMNDPDDFLVAPGQGFFVASQAGGGTVTFNPNMRTSGDIDDFIAMRTSAVVTNIKLSLSNATANFNTDIYFTEFTTLGLDPGYDASLFGGSAPSFALYTHLVEENNNVPFAIQALGETDYDDTIISLGVNASANEQLTFSILSSDLPSSVEVYLDDNVANTSTLLNSSDYVLTPTVNLSGTGRFYLRFNDSTLSATDNEFNATTVYTNNETRTIVISGHVGEHSIATIYDMQGRLVLSQTLDHNVTIQSIDTNSLKGGFYLVQLSNTTTTLTKKVIIR